MPARTRGASFRANFAQEDQSVMDRLFVALLLTSLAAYTAGNLLLLNRDVFVSTSFIMIPILAFWMMLYSISRATGSVLWGVCLAWLAVWLCCWGSGIGGYVVFVAGALFALVYVLINCRVQKGLLVPVAAMAVIGAATALSSPGVFTFFDNLEWAKGRGMHQDMAFHSAITAMIKNYGVVSTGLNGLIETPYYVGLHRLAALVSALSGQGALEVWGVLLYVFCLPLLIFAASYAAVGFGVKERALPVVWALVCLMLVVPQLLIDKWLPLRFLYFSESYIVATALLLLCLPLLSRSLFRWQDVVLATLATGVIAYTKATSAVFLVGLLGARWLVLERGKVGAGLAGVALPSIVLAVFIFGVTKSVEGSHGLTADILQIVRMGPGGDAVSQLVKSWSGETIAPLAVVAKAAGVTGLFSALHFALTWFALAAILRSEGWSSLFSSPAAVLVWSSALGGLFFAVFFTSSAGVNIWYFTSPSYFVALPVFVAWASTTLGRFSFPPKDWLTLSTALLVIIGASYKSYYRQSFMAPLRREAVQTDLFVDEMVALRRATPATVVMKADEKAWLIEPTYFMESPIRWSAPLVFVALSERAWINVIRPLGSTASYPHQDYSFAYYGIDPDGGRVAVPPVIPSGSEVIGWSPSKEMLDNERAVAARISRAWRKVFGVPPAAPANH
jgi:hypothetical protein